MSLHWGGEIIPGKQAKSLIREDDDTTTCEVECTDGTTFTADVVVITTGSWTPSAFAELDLEGECTATGYVAFS